MTLTPLIVVPGTWSWPPSDDAWYEPTSPFSGYLATRGRTIARGHGGRPFVWSTRATGYQIWDRLLGRQTQMQADWAAAATNLYAWVVPPLAPESRLPPHQTTILTHSHGIQVALLAAAQGLKIHTLIDIGGPVRKDIHDQLTPEVRANIGYWWHFRGGEDWWQRIGQLGDGTLRTPKIVQQANVVQRVPKAGHNRVLNDSAWMPLLDGVLSYAQQRYNTP